MNRVSELLRRVRRASGYSLRELAERAGTSAPTLSGYENGSREPMLSTLDRVVAAAGYELAVEVVPKMSRSDRVSLEYHRRLVPRLLDDPDGVRLRARQNLARLRRLHPEGRSDPYFDAWEELLNCPPSRLVATMEAVSDEAISLRHVSPFAGVLPEGERQAILAEAWSRG